MFTVLGICIYDENLAALLKETPLATFWEVQWAGVFIDEKTVRIKVDPRKIKETATLAKTFLSDLDEAQRLYNSYDEDCYDEEIDEADFEPDISNQSYYNDRDAQIYANYFESICTAEVAYAAIASFFPDGLSPKEAFLIKKHLSIAFSEDRIVFRPIEAVEADIWTDVPIKDYRFLSAHNPCYLLSFQRPRSLTLCKYLPKKQNDDGRVFVSKEIGYIGKAVFSFCENAKSIVFEERSQWSEKASLSNLVFINFPKLTELVLPPMLATEPNFIVNCPKLEKIVFFDGIQAINDQTVVDCPSLRSVTLPSSLIFVAPTAFPDLSRLPKETQEQIEKINEAFERITEDYDSMVKYIRKNGNSRFYPTLFAPTYSWETTKHAYPIVRPFAIDQAKEMKQQIESFHEKYDRFFVSAEKPLYQGSEKCPVRFTLLAEKGARDAFLLRAKNQLDELHWKYSPNNARVCYCVVDTDIIHERALSGESAILRDVLPSAEAGETYFLKMSDFDLAYKTGNYIDYAAMQEDLREQKQRLVAEAREAEKQAMREARAEAKRVAFEDLFNIGLSILDEIVQQNGAFYTKSAVTAALEERGLPGDKYLQAVESQGYTDVWQFLMERGIYKSGEMRFEEYIQELKRYYADHPKQTSVSAVLSEVPAPNIDLNTMVRQLKNMTLLEYLTEEGIIATQTESDIFEGVLYRPGEEPEDVKKWIDLLMSKFAEAFPDKHYSGLNTTHKKWGEAVTRYYRRLGYKSAEAFMAAYGYTPAGGSQGGRPKKDFGVVLEKIKERYPDGPVWTSVQELIADNPDYASDLNTMRAKSQQMFGMKFSDYCIQNGLLKAKE